jgi:hypothetical protein
MSKTSVLGERPGPSKEGSEPAPRTKNQFYIDIEKNLLEDFPNREDAEALEEIELPEPRVNLSADLQDEYEAVVDLLAAEADGPANMDKYYNVFEGSYQNQDDLLDDYRAKLSAIYQSESEGRRIACIGQ